jgi:hypothetical protein
VSRDDEYVPDVEVVDLEDWARDEQTKPGRATTAELQVECEVMAMVKRWLDEQEVQR